MSFGSPPPLFRLDDGRQGPVPPPPRSMGGSRWSAGWRETAPFSSPPPPAGNDGRDEQFVVGPNFLRCALCDVDVGFNIDSHLEGKWHRRRLGKPCLTPSIDPGCRIVDYTEAKAVAAQRSAAKTQRLEAKRRARTAAAETGGVGGGDAADGRTYQSRSCSL